MAFLVYDADCGFCTRSAKWLARSQRVHIKPWQALDLEQHGLTEEMVTEAAYWYDNGSLQAGEAAIAQALIARGGVWQIPGRVILLPGIRFVASRVYKVIARNRHAMPGGTNACKLPQ